MSRAQTNLTSRLRAVNNSVHTLYPPTDTDTVSTVGRLFYIRTLPAFLLRLAVCHLGTPYYPAKQSDSMAIALSYPENAPFTPRHRSPTDTDAVSTIGRFFQICNNTCFFAETCSMLSRHTNHHKNQSGFMAVTVSDTVNVCGHRTPSVYADTAFGYLHSTPQPPSVTIHVPAIDPPAAVYCAHKADSIRPTFAHIWHDCGMARCHGSTCDVRHCGD